MSDVVGYLDHWSARAGDALTLHVHTGTPQTLTADVVPLTEFSEAYLMTSGVGGAPVVFRSAPQHTPIGSCAHAAFPPIDTSVPVTFALLAHPTSQTPGTIAALASGGHAALCIHWTGAGTVQLVGHDGIVCCEAHLAMGQWSLVSVTVQSTSCTLHVQSHRRRPSSAAHAITPRSPHVDALDTLWLAARPDHDGRPALHFDGVLEAPVLTHGTVASDDVAAAYASPGGHVTLPGVIAAWDFAIGSATDVITDVGPTASHGTTHQGPTRLVPGAYWTPGVLDPARAPRQFAAIHFHQDDLRDASWQPCARISIPATLTSGVYGVRIRGNSPDVLDVIPFWVRAASPTEARPLAYLAPTYTYLAYGNAPNAMLGPAYWGSDHPAERMRKTHREFGLSLYSRHADHSGVSLASRHRPILTVRPGVRPWGFEADRLLTDWLHRHDYAFDTLTDEDIDREGINALMPHRVIVTGNHPEYWSARMLDALDAWLHDGGRLLYMGGNGFYWRISSLDALPGVIECRRAEGGTRPWISSPGCYHHQLDGDPGGLWRRLGRPPQALVGVGFSGQGFETSAPYQVRADARSGWTSFALAHVTNDRIGTSGRFGGGAAGQEIDRHDLRLGSPRDSVVLASSQGLHDAATLRTLEELLSHEPYANDPKVRADLTLTPVDGGGVVFATGSMAYVGALDDADISQVTRNVLDRFLDPAPLAPENTDAPATRA